MPVILVRKISPDLSIGIWKIEEEQSELEDMYGLSPTEKENLYAFKFVGRRLEWLASRMMLKELEESDSIIEKDEYGKPYVKDKDLAISIAHTFGYAAAAVAHETDSIGLDIELISSKAHKVRNKFLSSKEQNLIDKHSGSENEKYTLAWCAKEAIYKMYGRKLLDFREHMEISEVIIRDGLAFSVVLKKELEENHLVSFSRMEDLLITWCFK